MPAGQKPGQHRIEAKRRKYAFDLKGKPHITLSNIIIFAGAVETDSTSHHITIKNVNAYYLAHGTWIRWWWGSGAWETGMILLGSNSVVENCEIRWTADHGIQLGTDQYLNKATGANSRVINTIIRNYGYAGFSGGIIAGGDNITIEHNLIGNSGGWYGIASNRVTRSKIQYNVICDIGNIISDQGALYFNAPNSETEVAYNIVHDTKGIARLFGTQGIYLDPKASHFLIHHNVVWNTSGKSILLLGMDVGAMTDIKVYNNTFVGNPDTSYTVNGSPNGAVVMDAAKSVFKNNIIKWSWKGTNPGTEFTNNYEAGNRLYYPHDEVFDLFVNPANSNFMLKEGAAPIDFGVPVPPYTDDDFDNV